MEEKKKKRKNADLLCMRFKKEGPSLSYHFFSPSREGKKGPILLFPDEKKGKCNPESRHNTLKGKGNRRTARRGFLPTDEREERFAVG